MSEMRTREALNLALKEEMQLDDSVILMGEDIAVFGGAFKVTHGLLDQFGPQRVIDTPISENSIMGISIGALLAVFSPRVSFKPLLMNLLGDGFD